METIPDREAEPQLRPYATKIRASDFAIFAYIAVFLALAELALEVRANRRGYDTLLLGRPPAPHTISTHNEDYGPTQPFPFRSKITSPQAAEGVVRIWLSSSSYAEDSRFHASQVFPNVAARLASQYSGLDVQMLNRSAAGFTIRSNTEHLRELAERWKPDVAILYQLTNDLNQLAGPSYEGAPDLTQTPTATTNNLDDLLDRTYEQTSFFSQLSANVTPKVTIYRLLPASLPTRITTAFIRRLEEYVSVAESVGATPVLMTVALQVRQPDSLSRATRESMLRWNPHLSPQGHLRMLLRWNEAIRAVASRNGTPLIDMDSAMSGKAYLYRDLVHFTEVGHAEAGSFLAKQLTPIIAAVQ